MACPADGALLLTSDAGSEAAASSQESSGRGISTGLQPMLVHTANLPPPHRGSLMPENWSGPLRWPATVPQGGGKSPGDDNEPGFISAASSWRQQSGAVPTEADARATDWFYYPARV